MTDSEKEKLVELLRNMPIPEIIVFGQRCGKALVTAEFIANHLIANSVTVQEKAKLYWKPVKPREWHLTCSACDSHLVCREDANFCPECGAKFVRHKALMPQPPKGE